MPLLGYHHHQVSTLTLYDGLIFLSEVNVIGKLDLVFALIGSWFVLQNKL